MAEDDCITCGARVRHQRNIERRCPQCRDIFVVKSDRSNKVHCSRECYLEGYKKPKRPA
tara:strand:- start:501 stop:677 length:177 start_codon:yes stop_codon:yes gene_type:complete